MSEISRCPWCGVNPVYVAYHDTEWGVPVHDDRTLFEYLCLEGAEAGLSWIVVLNKRPHYRVVFDNFESEKVALYDDTKIEALVTDPGIIRSRPKIVSAVNNARQVLEVQAKYGSFDKFLWEFVGGQPIQNSLASMVDAVAESPESIALSKALKKLGFAFVGSKVCYAMMEAVGMVNDHLTSCFRHEQVRHLK